MTLLSAPSGIELDFEASCVSLGTLVALGAQEQRGPAPIPVKHSLHGSPHVDPSRGERPPPAPLHHHRRADQYELRKLSESLPSDENVAAMAQQDDGAHAVERDAEGDDIDGKDSAARILCCIKK